MGNKHETSKQGGHERDLFNSRFLGSLQALILETKRSQWEPRSHSVHLQRISNSWVEWETSHCLHYYFIMLELLKKLSETESLNRRVQILTIQEQQRKRSYQIADLTFTTANSWRDECLMRFRLVPHPFPWFPVTEHRALSMPGKCFTSELTSSPQTSSHHLDTLYKVSCLLQLPSGAGWPVPEQSLVGLESKTNAWPTPELLRSWSHNPLRTRKHWNGYSLQGEERSPG